MNEPYSNGPGPAGDGKGSGQFTHKVYHIGRWNLRIIFIIVNRIGGWDNIIIFSWV